MNRTEAQRFGMLNARNRAELVANTPGVTRTLNLRIWNPLLYQLSYRRSGSDRRPSIARLPNESRITSA